MGIDNIVMKERPKRIDVMLDIETLGVDFDCPILQVSAVPFNIAEFVGKDMYVHEIGKVFNSYVDITMYGDDFNVNPNTLNWWLGTDASLLKAIVGAGAYNGKSVQNVLRDLCRWIDNELEPNYNDVYLWGNGATFDNTIIRHKCKKYGLDLDISFRNDMDLRTLLNMASAKRPDLDIKDEVSKLFKRYQILMEKHNAYDDAVFQSFVAKLCYKILMENK